MPSIVDKLLPKNKNKNKDRLYLVIYSHLPHTVSPAQNPTQDDDYDWRFWIGPKDEPDPAHVIGTGYSLDWRFQQWHVDTTEPTVGVNPSMSQKCRLRIAKVADKDRIAQIINEVNISSGLNDDPQRWRSHIWAEHVVQALTGDWGIAPSYPVRTWSFINPQAHNLAQVVDAGNHDLSGPRHMATRDLMVGGDTFT